MTDTVRRRNTNSNKNKSGIATNNKKNHALELPDLSLLFGTFEVRMEGGKPSIVWCFLCKTSLHAKTKHISRKQNKWQNMWGSKGRLPHGLCDGEVV